MRLFDDTFWVRKFLAPDEGGGTAVADAPATESVGSESGATSTSVDNLNDYFGDDALKTVTSSDPFLDLEGEAEAEEAKAAKSDGEAKNKTPADSADTGSSGESDVDDELLRYASEVGISRADAKRFDKASLERVVYGILDRSVGQSAKQPATPAAQAPPEEKKPPSIDFNFDAMLPDGDFDPRLREAFKQTASKIQDAANARVAELEAKFGNVQQHLERQTQAEAMRAQEFVVNKFEDYLARLPEEYKDARVFGAGSIDDIDPKSEAHRNRNATLRDAVTFMRAGYPQDQAFKKAAAANVGDRILDAQRKQLSTKLEKSAKKFTIEPGARAKPTASREGIKELLDRLHKAKGVDPKTGMHL